MATKLSEIREKYKKFVVNNHELVGKIESTIRIISYFIPGQSVVLAELLYATSNLLIFVNDAILRKAARIKLLAPLPHDQLCSWLTVLEHIEVFLELAACGFGSDVIRWLVIFCVQVIKAVIKFILLLKYNSGILQTPPVTTLRRDAFLQKQLDKINEKGTEFSSRRESSLLINNNVSNMEFKATFTLPSSGRKVRTLSTAPPLTERRWHVPVTDDSCMSTSTPLTQLQTVGECLHITRPLCHLLSMLAFGRDSWKPWLVAGGVDATSLYLLGDSSQFNKTESKELRRRQMLMILYLLRSPFYDRFTKERLLFTLGVLATYVPGIRLIIRPLLEYLPWWQRIYFYVWMT